MVGAEQNPTMKQFWIAISTWVISAIPPVRERRGPGCTLRVTLPSSKTVGLR
jgi:hypothetical protein